MDFILSLETSTADKVDKTIRLLSIREYNLSMPHSKKIDKDLYELRIPGIQNIRVFYTFYNHTITLLHAIHKKDQKLRASDLKTARKRLDDLHF